MGEHDYQPSTGGQQHLEDEFDRELDAALARYAAVEPRTGLEERILVNLRAERTGGVDRAWWRWRLGLAATAVVVVGLTLAWRSLSPSPLVITNHSPIPAPGPGRTEIQVASHDEHVPLGQRHAPHRAVVRQSSHPETVVPSAPKLDQFPSQRPLSEQERILAAYVANYPERAALVAEARMEVLRKDREEKLRETGMSGNGDSQHIDTH